jgi:trimeric autotransporter adhesin
MKSVLPRSYARLIVLFFLTFIVTPNLILGQSDNCTGATLLTSNTSCVNTAGSIAGSTTNSTVAASPCGFANAKDVWYSFVAVSTSETVALSGGNNTRLRTEVYSGACGSLVSAGACIVGNSSATYTGLTIGNTYYIRVYHNNNSAGSFNICITHPALANDNCSGAITLTPAATCNPTSGTLTGASNSGVPWCWSISTDDRNRS